MQNSLHSHLSNALVFLSQHLYETLSQSKSDVNILGEPDVVWDYRVDVTSAPSRARHRRMTLWWPAAGRTCRASISSSPTSSPSRHAAHRRLPEVVFDSGSPPQLCRPVQLCRFPTINLERVSGFEDDLADDLGMQQASVAQPSSGLRDLHVPRVASVRWVTHWHWSQHPKKTTLDGRVISFSQQPQACGSETTSPRSFSAVRLAALQLEYVASFYAGGLRYASGGGAGAEGYH